MRTTRAEAVAEFAADWQRSLRNERVNPPRLADYVPDSTRARIAVLTDLVRIDLRRRWDLDGLGKRIAEYRKEFPEFDQSPALAELVCEEFVARCAREPITVETFLAEYPELADELRERLDALAGADAGTATAEMPGAAAALAPGRRIDDFDLLTDLGAGGTGRVFLARQLSMQRLVAVRFSAGAVGAPRTMAKLDHPHIVRVFDQRVLTGAQPVARLVYMQYLPGGTAVEVLAARRRGPETAGGALLLRAVDAAIETKGEIRPADSRIRAELRARSWPATVAWLGIRLAQALDYAAGQGIAHRAIKPSNVLFTAEGSPKLADFTVGTASAPPADADLDVPHDDSLPYRAPEELAAALGHTAARPDARSDIYSLGALLWELLTGAAPFGDNDASLETALAQRSRGVESTALERIPADCPATLRRVLLTCLEPDPDRRWHSGAMLAQQLELCLDDRARELVDPAPGWRIRLRRWRIPLITLAIVVPNAFASLYNIQHSTKLIHSKLSLQAQHQLDIGTAVVNSILPAAATALLLYLCRNLIIVPHGLRAGIRYGPETLRRARTDALLLGDRAVSIIFTMWMLSGISFPIVIRGAGDAITASDYAHFVIAHAVCGAIAVTYPFFLVNFYVIRYIYPMFLSHGELSVQDAGRLHRLRRRCGVYLIVAASIPLLAVTGATLLSELELTQIIVVVRVLSIGSVVAFVISYALFRTLEQDMHALERVLAPTKSVTLPG
ncbi:serine/threonine-protein kinase [Nocardia sp. NPDC052566]|uniref:serine/threonine-protein kinase n=1 Tax=Nocardia sp. NPDC052566 TaxID=3364330 RepID=UPI0037C81AD5